MILHCLPPRAIYSFSDPAAMLMIDWSRWLWALMYSPVAASQSTVHYDEASLPSYLLSRQNYTTGGEEVGGDQHDIVLWNIPQHWKITRRIDLNLIPLLWWDVSNINFLSKYLLLIRGSLTRHGGGVEVPVQPPPGLPASQLNIKWRENTFLQLFLLRTGENVLDYNNKYIIVWWWGQVSQLIIVASAE